MSTKQTEWKAPKTITFGGHRWKYHRGDEHRDFYQRADWQLEINYRTHDSGLQYEFGAILSFYGESGNENRSIDACVDGFPTAAAALLALERLLGDACGRVG